MLLITGVLFYQSYTFHGKAMTFLLENKVSDLQSCIPSCLNDSDVLRNDNQTTGELFALDSNGITTIPIRDFERDSYIPFSTQLDGPTGYQIIRGQLIAWHEIGDHRIVYSKLIFEAIENETLELLIVWAFALTLAYFVRRSERHNDEIKSLEHINRQVFDRLQYKIIAAAIRIHPTGFVVFDENERIVWTNYTLSTALNYFTGELNDVPIQTVFRFDAEKFIRLYSESNPCIEFNDVSVFRSDQTTTNACVTICKTDNVMGRRYFVATVNFSHEIDRQIVAHDIRCGEQIGGKR